MGLIVETPLQQNTNVVDDSTVVHVPAGRVCTDGGSSSNYEETGSFDMSIYRVFSMQDDMKTLVYPRKVKNEFDLFLQYAEAKTLGAVNASYDALDEYLGTIGITNTMCEV